MKIEFDIPFKQFKTHVYQYGDLNNDKEIIIILHGGPGSDTKPLKPLLSLYKKGYNVISYDQLGGGKSSIIKGHEELFKIETFVAELDNLIKYLKIKKYHILGHSWGAMLALEYVIRTGAQGLDKLILFSGSCSALIWDEENTKRSLLLLPKNQRARFLKAHQDKDNKTLNAIFKEYLKKTYKVDTNTSPYKKRDRKRFKGEYIYNYMWGKVDLFATGTLKNWDISKKLYKVKCPTLILYGKYDQSTPRDNLTMHKGIKNSRLVYLAKSSHCGYFNEYQKSIDSIDKFLKSKFK